MDITINTQEENPAPAPSTILASSGRAQKPGQFPQRQHQNLPRRITDQNNVVTDITYDATGRKWLQQTTTDARIYAGAVVLTKENGTYSLEAANTSDGRLVYDAEAVEVYPEFYHKDHLGNVRVAFADRNKDLKIELLGPTSEITQQNDYYPFGLRQEGDSLVFHQELSSSRYLYNGKEYSEDLGLYDYGARWYDPAIGRWNAVDNSAEKYVSQSPYHYSGNNPVLFVDYDGNDYGVSVDRKAKTITIRAHYLTSSSNKSKFDRRAKSDWNRQSGKNVFLAGGVKQLKENLRAGKETSAYTVNINLSSGVFEGKDNGSYSARDAEAGNDITGTVNSFDTAVGKFPKKNQNGATGNNEIDMKPGQEATGSATHEVAHTLGIAHDVDGGTIPEHGNVAVSGALIGEVLQGVGIGGDNSARNASSTVGDGTLLNGSSNQGLGQGRVISQKRYQRIVRRMERKNNR